MKLPDRHTIGHPGPLASLVIYLSGTNGLNAVLGAAFWFVAAVVLQPEDVGRASATLAFIALVANVSTLGAAIGLLRFRHDQSWDYATLIAGVLTVTAVTSVVLSGIVVAAAAADWGIREILAVSPLLMIPAVLVWCAAGLLDAMSIADSDGRAVLTRNTIANGLKLAAAFTLARTAPALVGLTVLSVAVSLLAVIRRRAALVSATRLVPRLPPKVFMRFSLAQYGVTLAVNAPIYLLPIIIASTLGTAAAGALAIVWGAGILLAAVGDATAAGILTAGSRAEAELDQLHRESGAKIAGPLLLLVLLGLVSAPLLQVPYRSLLSDEAVSAFRLLILASLPYLVVSTSISRFRAANDLWSALAVAALSGVGTCLAVAVLTQWTGIMAAGWGYLLANMLAAGLAATLIRASKTRMRSDSLRA